MICTRLVSQRGQKYFYSVARVTKYFYSTTNCSALLPTKYPYQRCSGGGQGGWGLEPPPPPIEVLASPFPSSLLTVFIHFFYGNPLIVLKNPSNEKWLATLLILIIYINFRIQANSNFIYFLLNMFLIKMLKSQSTFYYLQ